MNIKKICGGSSHTIVLSEEQDGESGNITTRLYSMGLNDEGQLGIGDTYSEYRVKRDKINQELAEEENKINEESKIKIEEVKEKITDEKLQHKEINKINNRSQKLLKIVDKKRNSTDESENSQYFAIPQLVKGATGFFDISAGANFSYGIRIRPAVENSKNEENKEDTNFNQVFSWGMGSSYVLCNKKEDSVYFPTEVKSEMYKGLNPLSISCGTMH